MASSEPLSFLKVGPQVRIRLPPAVSHVRTFHFAGSNRDGFEPSVPGAGMRQAKSILRWAENPRDALAGFRVLQLLPGLGPASAKKAMAHLGEHGFDLGELAGFVPPDAAALPWPGFCRMLRRLRDAAIAWAGQVGLVRAWYQPHLERLYDYASSRAGDLDQLEQIAMGYPNRERFLSEVTLDPPDAAGAAAGL